MEIILQLPDPKFKEGDIVTIKNHDNDLSRTMFIHKLEIIGEWKYTTKDGVQARVVPRMIAGGDITPEESVCWYYIGEWLPDSWTETDEPVSLTGEVTVNIGTLEKLGIKQE